MVSVTVACGARNMDPPADAGPATIARSPADGTRAETTAKRIDPSGQRTLTSVWVGRSPTRTPSRAAPGGRARPNVAAPGVNAYRASAASGGAPAAAIKKAAARTIGANMSEPRGARGMPDRSVVRGGSYGNRGCRSADFTIDGIHHGEGSRVLGRLFFRASRMLLQMLVAAILLDRHRSNASFVP